MGPQEELSCRHSKTQTQAPTSTLPGKNQGHSPPPRSLDSGFHRVGFLTLGDHGASLLAQILAISQRILGREDRPRSLGPQSNES